MECIPARTKLRVLINVKIPNDYPWFITLAASSLKPKYFVDERYKAMGQSNEKSIYLPMIGNPGLHNYSGLSGRDNIEILERGSEYRKDFDAHRDLINAADDLRKIFQILPL